MSVVHNAIVLRFRKGQTDKVWVICPELGVGSGHLVFWGASRWTNNTTHKLQGKTVSGSFESRITKKRKEGYAPWCDNGFDIDAQRVFHVDVSKASQQQASAGAEFWYRIDLGISTQSIAIFLNTLRQELAVYESESQIEPACLVDQFNALSLVTALKEGRHSGSVNYTDGPLAALLLFALRRAYSSYILVSDDDNEMLPSRFDELYTLLSNEHLFGRMPNHWMPPAFKDIGIALRCLDRPIDLTAITSDKPSAYL